MTNQKTIEGNLYRSTWLRKLYIEQPETETEDVLKLWKQNGNRPKNVDVSEQKWYQAKSDVHRVIGDIPRDKKGVINRTQLVRNFLKANAGKKVLESNKKIVDSLAKFGVEVSTTLVAQAMRSTKIKPIQKIAEETSVVSDNEPGDVVNDYAFLESELDKLIAMASDQLNDNKMTEAMRKARRIASAQLVE